MLCSMGDHLVLLSSRTEGDACIGVQPGQDVSDTVYTVLKLTWIQASFEVSVKVTDCNTVKQRQK